MRVQPFESPWAAPGQVEKYAPAIVAEQALQQLLRYPRLPEVVRRLQAIARAEAKKRRYFYEVVTEQQKAEFINGEIIVHSPVKYQHNIASAAVTGFEIPVRAAFDAATQLAALQAILAG